MICQDRTGLSDTHDCYRTTTPLTTGCFPGYTGDSYKQSFQHPLGTWCSAKVTPVYTASFFENKRMTWSITLNSASPVLGLNITAFIPGSASFLTSTVGGSDIGTVPSETLLFKFRPGTGTSNTGGDSVLGASFTFSTPGTYNVSLSLSGPDAAWFKFNPPGSNFFYLTVKPLNVLVVKPLLPTYFPFQVGRLDFSAIDVNVPPLRPNVLITYTFSIPAQISASPASSVNMVLGAPTYANFSATLPGTFSVNFAISGTDVLSFNLAVPQQSFQVVSPVGTITCDVVGGSVYIYEGEPRAVICKVTSPLFQPLTLSFSDGLPNGVVASPVNATASANATASNATGPVPTLAVASVALQTSPTVRPYTPLEMVGGTASDPGPFSVTLARAGQAYLTIASSLSGYTVAAVGNAGLYWTAWQTGLLAGPSAPTNSTPAGPSGPLPPWTTVLSIPFTVLPLLTIKTLASVYVNTKEVGFFDFSLSAVPNEDRQVTVAVYCSNPDVTVTPRMFILGASGSGPSPVYSTSSKIGVWPVSPPRATFSLSAAQPGSYTIKYTVSGDAAYMFDPNVQPTTFTTSYQAPIVTAVVPDSAGLQGGDIITLYGSHFGLVGGEFSGVSLVGTQCLVQQLQQPSMVSCKTRSRAAAGRGPAIVRTKFGGESQVTRDFSYLRVPPPVAYSVAPSDGLRSGGAVVFVHGANFGVRDTHPTIFIGANPCLGTTWISSTLLRCDGVPECPYCAPDVDTPMTVIADVEGQVTDPITPDELDSVGRPTVRAALQYLYRRDCPGCTMPNSVCGQNFACQCAPGWVSPGCLKRVVSFTLGRPNATMIETREGDNGRTDRGVNLTSGVWDRMDASFEEIIVTLHSLPPDKVTVTASCQHAVPSQASFSPAQLTFTQSSASTTGTFTVLGTSDGVRDGAHRNTIHCTTFSTARDWSLAYTGFDSVIYDDSPDIVDIVPALSPIAGGALITVVGSHFDPTVSWTIGGISGNSSTFAQGAAKPARLTAEAAGDFSLSLFPAENATGVVISTPPQPPGMGYYTVTVINADGSRSSIEHLLFYTDDCPTPGMYGTGSKCSPCPTGADCPGGNRIRPKPGYWNSGEDSGFVSHCLPESRCPGYDNSTHTVPCNPGYQGDYCARCVTGNYMVDHVCYRCKGGQWIYTLADFLVWVVLSMAIWWLESDENVSFVISFVLAVQTIAGIGKLLGGTMPDWMVTAYGLFKMFASDVSTWAMDCYGKQEHVPLFQNLGLQLGYFAAIFVMMFGGTALTGACSILWHRKRGRDFVQNRKIHYKDRMYRCLTMHPTLVYLTLSTSCLAMLTCMPYKDGKLRLLYDPTVVCFKGEHLPVLALALPTFIIFSLLFPLSYYIFLRRNRDRIDQGSFKRRW